MPAAEYREEGGIWTEKGDHTPDPPGICHNYYVCAIDNTVYFSSTILRSHFFPCYKPIITPRLQVLTIVHMHHNTKGGSS